MPKWDTSAQLTAGRRGGGSLSRVRAVACGPRRKSVNVGRHLAVRRARESHSTDIPFHLGFNRRPTCGVSVKDCRSLLARFGHYFPLLRSLPDSRLVVYIASDSLRLRQCSPPDKKEGGDRQTRRPSATNSGSRSRGAHSVVLAQTWFRLCYESIGRWQWRT
ncbi:hypothetical protein Pla52n_08950 [Stieleria varia]|uniref:Uncharacterized protein n=1 Tax=Stieleria varia TaxID=2528005 RepID=A0A5C6B8A3_9BACT|nr:hypothetical protein Pla52n_08950 [Stieleria varia]